MSMSFTVGALLGLAALEGVCRGLYRGVIPERKRQFIEYLLTGQVPSSVAFDDAVHRASLMRYRGHPSTAFEPNPDFITADGVRIHNNCSFRDRDDFTREYLDAFDLRVYLAGGSTVYDTCVEDNAETLAVRLEDALQRRTGKSVKVINAGVGNFTTFQSATRFAAWADFLRPHVVVVYQGINDITPFLYTDAPREGIRPDYAHSIRPLSVAEVRERLPRSARWSHIIRLISALRVTDEDFNIRFHTLAGSHKVHHIGDDVQFAIDHIAARINYDIIRSHYENLLALAHYRDTPVVYLTERLMDGDDWYKPFLGKINDIIRSLGVLDGASVLDFDREFPRHAEDFADSMHFSATGNARRAEFIAEYLSSSLGAQKETAA